MKNDVMKNDVMKNDVVQRNVTSISTPVRKQGMNALHRIRELLPFSASELTDPFLMLMEDWFPEGVFDRHPHRGMETVTYVISGQIDHYDNQGNSGSIRPGDVQWMTAGRGIIHNEQPAPGQTVHSLQLWVNLPKVAKMVAPRYQELASGDAPVRRETGVEVRVFSGSSGAVAAPTKNYAAVTMLEVSMAPESEISLDLPGAYNAFMVVLSGAGVAGADRTAIEKEQVVLLSKDNRLPLSAVTLATDKTPLKLLLYAGLPIGEPVATGGPFVMNTQQEVQQAFEDYRAGRF